MDTVAESAISNGEEEVLPLANGHEKIEQSNIDPPDTDSLTEHQSSEYLQRKLYFLLEHLKKFHSALSE
jgi:hypothetical protein